MKHIDKMYLKKFHLILSIYGLLTTILTSYFIYDVTHRQIVDKVILDGRSEIKSINNEINDFTYHIENILSSINTNRLFLNFINSRKTTDKTFDVGSLFLNEIDGHKDLFQIRYIDENGMEIIRAEVNPTNGRSFLKDKSVLQDKSHRYYFKETKKITPYQFWYSNFDLNMENGILEKPYRPTWRVSTPVYFDGEFKGILIASVQMNYLLSHMKNNTHSFDLIIADNSGVIIEEPSGKFSFSSFKGNPVYIYEIIKNLNEDNWREDLFFKYYANVLPLSLKSSISDPLFLSLMPKNAALESSFKSLFRYVVNIALFILFISGILALVISVPFSKLHKNLILAEEENEKYIKQIEKTSRTDCLTKLGNRYAIDEKMDEGRALFQRYNTPFSALLIDIDHFKKVNDTYGHLIGDYVLESISELLKNHIREADFVGRWGGEEFIVICEETDIQGALELAEHLRVIIQDHDFGDIPNQSISIGVCEFGNNDSTKSFLKRLDECVYKAKKSGRNRVVSS